MDAGKVALAILAVGGIVGLIYFMTRPSHSSSEVKALSPGRESEVKALSPSRETRQYSNTEVWEIDWDKDGLPRKVVITRKATQT